MSLHYILDGYNIIKSVDIMADCSLENGRSRLIEMIRRERPQGSERNRVTIIFDGREDVWSLSGNDVVKSIFTSGESADDLIKRMVADEPNPKNVIVVSDDRDLVCYVRLLQAGTMTVNDFLCLSQVKKVTLRNKECSKAISYRDQQEINKELESIWLKQRKTK